MDKDQLQEFLDAHGGLQARGRWVKHLKKHVNHNEDTLKWAPKPLEQPCPTCLEWVVDRRINIKISESGKIKEKCTICHIDIRKLNK
jgi:hypothetical protein